MDKKEWENSLVNWDTFLKPIHRLSSPKARTNHARAQVYTSFIIKLDYSIYTDTMKTFDGRTWECMICGNTFDLLNVNNYRCPKCRTQVKMNDVLLRSHNTICHFQQPMFVPDYEGLGCGLTGIGETTVFQGMDLGTSARIIHACNIDTCPIYQTWKLLKEPS